MQQYFIDGILNINDIIKLEDDILFHIQKVLRKRNDYTFRLVDNDKRVYLAKLVNNQAKIIEEIIEERELNYNLVLAMALIKHDRFEWAIQKATELGVKEIIPFISERVVIKDNSENKRLDRYRKIIKEASEQSNRLMIPSISSFKTLDDIINIDIENKLMAYEKEDKVLIGDDFKKDTLVIIGPEGGFSEEEYHKLVNNGFNSISLGKRILRAETAAVCALSIISRGME